MKAVRQQIGGLGNLMFKQAYLIGQALDGNIPDIYVQSDRYWKKHTNTIRQTFNSDIEYVDMVALQIRRGDYLGNKFYVDLTKTDYYDKAIAMFPNDKFLIFCADRQNVAQDNDDNKWCVEWAKAKGINFEMYAGWSETNDLNKMASCKAKIIANSSFGWWAGFLGEGKVIAPKDFFADGQKRIDYPEGWDII